MLFAVFLLIAGVHVETQFWVGEFGASANAATMQRRVAVAQSLPELLSTQKMLPCARAEGDDCAEGKAAEQSAEMAEVGDRPNETGEAEDQPGEQKSDGLSGKGPKRLRVQFYMSQQIAEQAIADSREPTKKDAAADGFCNIREDGQQANHQSEACGAVAGFEHESELPNPHPIEDQVQQAEVQKDRRDESPNLSFFDQAERSGQFCGHGGRDALPRVRHFLDIAFAGEKQKVQA